MRNPIRPKNLNLRFFPYYAAGLLVLIEIEPSGPGFGAGLAAILLGALLRGWGAGHLVKNDLLTITGPYAFVRHPLYLGTMSIGVGFAVMAGGWVPWLLLAVGLPWFFLDYFPRKERVESERLEERYGDAYLVYRDAVPPLLPRTSAWQPTLGYEGVADPKARWRVERYLDNNELGVAMALMVGLVLVAWRITLAP